MRVCGIFMVCAPVLLPKATSLRWTSLSHGTRGPVPDSKIAIEAETFHRVQHQIKTRLYFKSIITFQVGLFWEMPVGIWKLNPRSFVVRIKSDNVYKALT